MDTFYLGTPAPHWVGAGSPLLALHHERAGDDAPPVPMCVSRARTVDRVTFPEAVTDVMVDSAGFSVLDRDLPPGEYTDWDVGPHEFIRQMRRIRDGFGERVVAMAPMDMMCERFILAKTGLTVREHEDRTVLSFTELRMLAPDLPIFPVIQGNSVASHLRCADAYEQAGIDLTQEPIVGIGSICRLQSTRDIVDLVAALVLHFGGNIRLHGFGVKKTGLALCAPGLTSADSMAWSRRGRAAGPCVHGLGHKTEANCHHFALDWYHGVLAAAASIAPQQWARAMRAYVRRSRQDGLFAPPPPPAPNMPSTAERIALALRAFLPEGEQAAFARQVDELLRKATDAMRITPPGP